MLKKKDKVYGGKKMVQWGQMIPQSLMEEKESYLKQLEKRKIISSLNLERRNTIRDIERLKRE